MHEIDHLSFYDFLDDKKDEYMKGFEAHQKYTDTAMESVAFQIQIDYLKNLGKTKEQCLAFMKSYVEESSSEDNQEEIAQLTQYVNSVYKN